jgi:hypothetical protein
MEAREIFPPWRCRCIVEKFRDHSARERGEPYEVLESEGNLALNEGLNYIWSRVCAGSGAALDSANAHLGVGDSSAAADAAQTGLQAATNKLYKAVDPGYPTYGTAQQVTLKATFSEAEANFAWEEWSVANGDSDAAVNLNRKVERMGTKPSGEIWTLSAVLTLQ